MPLPDVAAKLWTEPDVLAVPPTLAPPAANPGTANAPPLPFAVAFAADVALLILRALPLPALDAEDTVPEEALEDVFVAAMLELLTAAEAMPARAITAIAIRDFFMMVPLNADSQFFGS
ncbi:hypothetical protein V8Z74_21985 [Comamonas sp. w2-DMI]|uniref:hypothetical protein n=1 Tax=Comamonas sp. w2-DMI TaxID=3126391 RepID=UPI0032E46387